MRLSDQWEWDGGARETKETEMRTEFWTESLKSLRRPISRRRSEDNIKEYLKDMMWGGGLDLCFSEQGPAEASCKPGSGRYDCIKWTGRGNTLFSRGVLHAVWLNCKYGRMIEQMLVTSENID
jgi:hypothetical protein